jgi:serine/threonine protein kinase
MLRAALRRSRPLRARRRERHQNPQPPTATPIANPNRTPLNRHPQQATDFGLSIRHSADEPKLTSRSGTPAYMAPELVMQCYGGGRAGGLGRC